MKLVRYVISFSSSWILDRIYLPIHEGYMPRSATGMHLDQTYLEDEDVAPISVLVTPIPTQNICVARNTVLIHELQVLDEVEQ